MKSWSTILRVGYIVLVFALFAALFSNVGYNFAANMSFRHSNGRWLAAFGYWVDDWSFLWHPRLPFVACVVASLGHFIADLDWDSKVSRRFLGASIGFYLLTILVMIVRYYAWKH